MEEFVVVRRADLEELLRELEELKRLVRGRSSPHLIGSGQASQGARS